MIIRFLLDNIVISEMPDGWDKRKTKIRYDNQIKGRIVTMDATLEWFDDGYAYIKNVFDDNICNEISVRIQQSDQTSNTWVDVYVGKIKMPDCEWHISPYYVKTPIVDNGYFARISGNKGIKSRVDNAKTKNDKPCTVPTQRSISFFRPHNGNYSYTGRKGYLLYDLFKYLISFMSDNEVGFISDTFNYTTNGAYHNYVALLGIEIRLGATNTDKVFETSFADLFSEVDKKFNIGFRMDYIGGKPHMRIEAMSWFYENNATAQFNYLRDIKKRVDANSLYASVAVGSSTTLDEIGLKFPENTRWNGFKDEQFYLLGQCNIDKELRLVGNWVVSPNVIEAVVETNDDGYDDEIFLVELTNVVSFQARKSNWLTGTTPPFYYNEHLKNADCVNRWLDGIPQTIVGQLGLGNNRFIAYRKNDGYYQTVYPSNPCNNCYYDLAELSSAPRSKFEDDHLRGYDPNNRYGNGTAQGTDVTQTNARYTAPAAGQYLFESAAVFNFLPSSSFNPGSAWIATIITFNRYSSTNVLLQTLSSGTMTQLTTSTTPITKMWSTPINLNTGDYVECKQLVRAVHRVYYPGVHIDCQLLKESYFACSYCSIDEGGTYEIIENAEQKFMTYSVDDVPITEKQMNDIIGNTSGFININTNGGNNYSGWINEFNIDVQNRSASIELLGIKVNEPKND
jgi:hypothetical protein